MYSNPFSFEHFCHFLKQLSHTVGWGPWQPPARMVHDDDFEGGQCEDCIRLYHPCQVLLPLGVSGS